MRTKSKSVELERMDSEIREKLMHAAPEDAETLAEALFPIYLKRGFSGPKQVPDTKENREFAKPIMKEVIRKALEPLMGHPVGIHQIHSAIVAAASETARGFRSV